MPGKPSPVSPTHHPLLILKSRSSVPGRKANEKERQAALQVADGFISRMSYSPNTQVRTGPHLLLGPFLWLHIPRLDKSRTAQELVANLPDFGPVRWKDLFSPSPLKTTKQQPKSSFQRESWKPERQSMTLGGWLSSAWWLHTSFSSCLSLRGSHVA